MMSCNDETQWTVLDAVVLTMNENTVSKRTPNGDCELHMKYIRDEGEWSARRSRKLKFFSKIDLIRIVSVLIGERQDEYERDIVMGRGPLK